MGTKFAKELHEFDINLYTENGGAIIFAHQHTIEDPARQRYHLNNMCEVYLGLTKGVQIIVDGVCYKMEPGDIMIIPPFAVHRIVLEQHDWYERFYFVISLHAFTSMDHNPLDSMMSIKKGMGQFVSLPQQERELAIELLYKISAGASKREPHYRLIVYALFLQFIGLITAHLATNTENQDGQHYSKIPKLLQDVLVYIDQNISKVHQVEKIAEQFHMSLRQLSGMFNEHLHTGIKQYILMKRIVLSKRLLIAGQSVTYTCYEAGFSDTSYFIKTFKRYVGMTPLKFQSSMPGVRYF